MWDEFHHIPASFFCLFLISLFLGILFFGPWGKELFWPAPFGCFLTGLFCFLIFDIPLPFGLDPFFMFLAPGFCLLGSQVPGPRSVALRKAAVQASRNVWYNLITPQSCINIDVESPSSAQYELSVTIFAVCASGTCNPKFKIAVSTSHDTWNEKLTCLSMWYILKIMKRRTAVYNKFSHNNIESFGKFVAKIKESALCY